MHTFKQLKTAGIIATKLQVKLILSVVYQLKELETFSNSGGKEFELDTYTNKKHFPQPTHTA